MPRKVLKVEERLVRAWGDPLYIRIEWHDKNDMIYRVVAMYYAEARGGYVLVEQSDYGMESVLVLGDPIERMKRYLAEEDWRELSGRGHKVLVETNDREAADVAAHYERKING